METGGQLSAGIAHDFNTLLSVILGYCELIEERPGLSNRSAKCSKRFTVQAHLPNGRSKVTHVIEQAQREPRPRRVHKVYSSARTAAMNVSRIRLQSRASSLQ